MFRFLMASVLVAVFVCEVDARPRRRRCVNCYNSSQTRYTPYTTTTNGAYNVASTATPVTLASGQQPVASGTPIVGGSSPVASSPQAVASPVAASGPQAVAASKAQMAAARGIKGHVGGGYGGGNAEGVGWSSYSPQNALDNCCFTGQRRVAGQAVVRGRDGWYAVKIFW